MLLDLIVLASSLFLFFFFFLELPYFSYELLLSIDRGLRRGSSVVLSYYYG